MGEFFALATRGAWAEKIPCHEAKDREQQDSRPKREAGKSGARVKNGHEGPDVDGPCEKHHDTEILHHLNGPLRLA